MSLKWADKDPDDLIDYSIDFTSWLDSSDIISTVTWKMYDADNVLQTWTPTQVINGLQYVSSTFTDKVATIYIGLGTAFVSYRIICRIDISDGTIYEEEVRLRVVEKT